MSYFEDVVQGAGGDFTPTQELLASVLEVALQDFARPGHGAKVQRYRSNARRWLFGTPLTGDGLDFDQVCDSLHLQPELVRRLALAGRVRLFPMAESKAPRRRPFEPMPRARPLRSLDDGSEMSRAV